MHFFGAAKSLVFKKIVILKLTHSTQNPMDNVSGKLKVIMGIV